MSLTQAEKQGLVGPGLQERDCDWIAFSLSPGSSALL
jgi:hypothetical protein